jgi:kelch-like protein 2/3
VILIAKEEEFSAHKTVLAACSPYFNAMFSCFEESRQNRIQLQDIDPKALSLLLDYVYTAEVQVTEENVQVCKLLVILSSSNQQISFCFPISDLAPSCQSSSTN